LKKYCSVTGFGHHGIYRNPPCYDLISEGIASIMSVKGDNDQPQKVGTAGEDMLAAHQACFAIASYLYRHIFTGVGEFVDVCLANSVVSFVTPRIVGYLPTGGVPST